MKREVNIFPLSGSFSDDDNEPIPDFLLPNYSHSTDKSPHLPRGFSPPKIIKASLKSFSGLEGSHLPSQDSVDLGNLGTRPRVSESAADPASEETTSESQSLASSIVSISQENRVKIQVPGLPVSKTSKSSLSDQ